MLRRIDSGCDDGGCDFSCVEVELFWVLEDGDGVSIDDAVDAGVL